ncbi:hypothetical protein [Acinetobacter sp. ANC 3813]|nr:hypothetical protein [Acinetobacter sp. ANC 3813]
MAQSFQYNYDRQDCWLGLNPFSFLNAPLHVFDAIRFLGAAA